MKMMIGLISSAHDLGVVFGICDYLGTMKASDLRSTAEVNLRLLPNQQTRKAVVERANERTNQELVRLAVVERAIETAVDCSAYLAEKLTDQPVLRVDEFFTRQERP